MDNSIDVSKENWTSVPAFGDWEKLQGMPDYSMDFSKIRENRKQSKFDYSRISTGSEADLLSRFTAGSARAVTAAPPVLHEKQTSLVLGFYILCLSVLDFCIPDLWILTFYIPGLRLLRLYIPCLCVLGFYISGLWVLDFYISCLQILDFYIPISGVFGFYTSGLRILGVKA